MSIVISEFYRGWHLANNTVGNVKSIRNVIITEDHKFSVVDPQTGNRTDGIYQTRVAAFDAAIAAITEKKISTLGSRPCCISRM